MLFNWNQGLLFTAKFLTLHQTLNPMKANQDIYLCYCYPADPEDTPFYKFMTEYNYAHHNDDEAEVSLKVMAVIPYGSIWALIGQLEGMITNCRKCDADLSKEPFLAEKATGYCTACMQALEDKADKEFEQYEKDMFSEDEDTGFESPDDYEERMEEERAETASNCTCGAWSFTKSGSPVHIADCICGAG